LPDQGFLSVEAPVGDVTPRWMLTRNRLVTVALQLDRWQ